MKRNNGRQCYKVARPVVRFVDPPPMLGHLDEVLCVPRVAFESWRRWIISNTYEKCGRKPGGLDFSKDSPHHLDLGRVGLASRRVVVKCNGHGPRSMLGAIESSFGAEVVVTVIGNACCIPLWVWSRIRADKFSKCRAGYVTLSHPAEHQPCRTVQDRCMDQYCMTSWKNP